MNLNAEQMAQVETAAKMFAAYERERFLQAVDLVVGGQHLSDAELHQVINRVICGFTGSAANGVEINKE